MAEEIMAMVCDGFLLWWLGRLHITFQPMPNFGQAAGFLERSFDGAAIKNFAVRRHAPRKSVEFLTLCTGGESELTCNGYILTFGRYLGRHCRRFAFLERMAEALSLRILQVTVSSVRGQLRCDWQNNMAS